MCFTHGESTSRPWTAINAGQELARKETNDSKHITANTTAC